MGNIKVFCLPYAGGNSSIYYSWKKKVKKGIEIIPIEYKGHGSSIMEGLYSTIDEAVNDVLAKILEKVNDTEFDYMIYGHSMGAILTFETAYRLCTEQLKKPLQIILAGVRPPHLIKKDKKISHLSKDEFMYEVYCMGEMSKEIFEDKELYDIYYEVLSSDFRLVEHYGSIKNKKTVDISTIVLTGQNDDEAPEKCMIEWKEYVNADFQFYTLPGNHFFAFNQEEDFFKLFNRII